MFTYISHYVHPWCSCFPINGDETWRNEAPKPTQARKKGMAKGSCFDTVQGVKNFFVGRQILDSEVKILSGTLIVGWRTFSTLLSCMIIRRECKESQSKSLRAATSICGVTIFSMITSEGHCIILYMFASPLQLLSYL